MIKEHEVLVIDDFISKEYQEQIKNTLIGEALFNGHEFPWHYIEDVTACGDHDSQHRPALYHQYMDFINENQKPVVDSKFHDLFVPLLQRGSFKGLGTTKVNALQGRSFLQFPLNLKNYDVDNPHIDLVEGHKHIVVLYYVCDSDGDTIIYNEKTKSDEYTIKERVTPKQGRVVIFDGGLYHTAEQPINNVRCVVNYNLDLK